MAPFYRSDAQPITVVLFDDPSIRALGLAWPPPYSVTVALLRKVLCANPRAVFVDLLFTHQHDADPALDNLALHLSGDRGCRNAAPVLVADMADQRDFRVPGDTVVLDRLRRRAEAQRGVVQRVPVNWVAERGLYPLTLDVIAPENWPTRLDGADGPVLPTPAFALYRIMSPGATGRDFADPMVVRWGFTPQAPPPSGVTLEGGCYDPARREPPWQIALRQIGLDLFKTFEAPGPRQRCPYNVAISAHTALEGGSSRQGGELHGLFHDRYVLIGAALAGSNDVTVSPVHGQLPGVFLHAMALDNLLRFHAGYWRPIPAIGSDGVLARVSGGALLSIALFVGFVLLDRRLFKPWRAKCRVENIQGMVSLLALLELLLVLLTILVVILILIIGHYSPINWLGLIGLWIGAALTVSEELDSRSGFVTERPPEAAPASARSPIPASEETDHDGPDSALVGRRASAAGDAG